MVSLWRCSYKMSKTIFVVYWVHMWKGMWKKFQVWISCLWLVSRSPKPGCFLGKFKSYFQAEIIPWSLLFLDFLIAFHMVWKKQESWESWLVGFWVNSAFKNAKNFCQQFFWAFLSRHYGFANYFEILIFAFSNITPRGVSTCKILPFWD